MLCVVEHPFLCENGNYRGDKGNHSGDLDRIVISADDGIDTAPAYAHSCGEKYAAENDRSYAFEAVMTVWVVLVSLAGGELYAYHCDKCGENVRHGMYGVGYHGGRISQSACGKLERRKNGISDKTYGGHLSYGDLICNGNVFGFFHTKDLPLH